MKLLLVLSVFLSTVFSPENSLSQSADFVISNTEVGQFKIGNESRRIWASLRNEGQDPSKWQFRYDALFLPEVDAAGKLVVRQQKIGDKWRVSLKLYLDSDQAARAAFTNLTNIYPTEFKAFQPSSVSALAVTSISGISIPALVTYFPDVTLETEHVSFAHPTSAVTIYIGVKDETAAKAVAEFLQTGVLVNYSMSFSAKSAQQNLVTIKYSDIRNSSLYVKLNGLNNTTTFIHRDDLRQLMEGISVNFQISGVIENPDRLDQELTKTILERLATQINATSEQFSNEQWKTTYNGDDLKPDVVTKELNKLFTYDSSKDQWTKDSHYAGSASANVFSVVSASVSGDVSLSETGLKELLKQHDINTEFEGHKLVVNPSIYKDSTCPISTETVLFTSKVVYVGVARDPISGSLDIENALASDYTQASIPTKVATLQSQVMPIGSIVAFAGAKRIRQAIGKFAMDRNLPPVHIQNYIRQLAPLGEVTANTSIFLIYVVSFYVE